MNGRTNVDDLFIVASSFSSLRQFLRLPIRLVGKKFRRFLSFRVKADECNVCVHSRGLEYI